MNDAATVLNSLATVQDLLNRVLNRSRNECTLPNSKQDFSGSRLELPLFNLAWPVYLIKWGGFGFVFGRLQDRILPIAFKILPIAIRRKAILIAISSHRKISAFHEETISAFSCKAKRDQCQNVAIAKETVAISTEVGRPQKACLLGWRSARRPWVVDSRTRRPTESEKALASSCGWEGSRENAA